VHGSGPPSSRTFAIGDESHTLGNALRHILISNASVEFAGYSVPHPNEPVMHVRVQCARGTAIEALRGACQTLGDQCDLVLEALEREIPDVKEDRLRLEKMAEAMEVDEYDEEEEMEEYE